MSLAFQIESTDGLDESIASMYTEKDGKFQLSIDGLPDVSEYESRIHKMDGKINELLDEKKKVSAKAKEAEELARKEAEESAKRSGDVDALDQSWQQKYSDLEKSLRGEFEPRVSELQSLLENATVDATAARLASKLAIPGSADALILPIKQRLKMEVKDGKAVTVVTDFSGKPSASNLEDLEKEFFNSAAYAPIIAGSKATGGGAKGSNGGAGKNVMARSDFQAKTPAERKAFIGEGGSVVD